MPTAKSRKRPVQEERSVQIVGLKVMPEHAGAGEIEQLELLLPDVEVFNLVDALLHLDQHVPRSHERTRPAAVIRVDVRTGSITVSQGEWKPTYPGRSKELDRERKRSRKRSRNL